MEPDEALRLIRGGEGQRVEFKTSFAEDNEAIGSLGAFANAGGGTVFFGVKPDGTIVGVDLGANTLENFINKLRRESQPPLSPRIDSLDIDGKVVVSASVATPEPGQLFQVFKKTLVRVGPTNQVMSPEEQRARLQESQPNSVEKLHLEVTPDHSIRRSPVVQEMAILTITTEGVGDIQRCYGHVLEVLWDEQAEFRAWIDGEGQIVNIDENSRTPIFVPIWTNHDIYLRWTGQRPTERHHSFAGNAVLEVAVDTWKQGIETAFFAAANREAETEYILNPGHEYLVTVEIGAENVRPFRKCYRLSLVQSHLQGGLLSRRRLEVEEVDPERLATPPSRQA